MRRAYPPAARDGAGDEERHRREGPQQEEGERGHVRTPPPPRLCAPAASVSLRLFTLAGEMGWKVTRSARNSARSISCWRTFTPCICVMSGLVMKTSPTCRKRCVGRRCSRRQFTGQKDQQSNWQHTKNSLHTGSPCSFRRFATGSAARSNKQCAVKRPLAHDKAGPPHAASASGAGAGRNWLRSSDRPLFSAASMILCQYLGGMLPRLRHCRTVTPLCSMSEAIASALPSQTS